MRTYLAVFASLVASATAAQTPPARISGATDLELNYNFLGIGIESRCNSDWFVIEGDFWKCVRRAGDFTLAVSDFGPLPYINFSFNRRVIQRPIAGDRRIYISGAGAGAGFVYALDPVTTTVTMDGTLPQGSVSNPIRHADYDGDGHPELVMTGSGATPARLVTLRGGIDSPYQIVRDLPFVPAVTGQFDGDARSELLLNDGVNAIRLFDAGTLADELLIFPHLYSTARPAWSGDWTGDGIDGFALPHSSADRLGMFDLPATTLPVFAFPMGAGPFQALGLVDWTGPGSRDLVVNSNTFANVVDPQNGGILASSAIAGAHTSTPEPLPAMDWDNDGDQDFLWQDGQNHELRWLRNPQGLVIAQRGAAFKQTLGYLADGGPLQLVTAESFGPPLLGETRIRVRDANTLAQVSEVRLPELYDRCALADLHANSGVEILCNDQKNLRLYSLAGAQIWQRSIENPLNSYRQILVPDFTCVGAGCRRFLVLEDRIDSKRRVRMLHGANGDELWSSEFETDALALGFSDLTGDGVADPIYSFGVPSFTINALDGSSLSPVWQRPWPEPVGLTPSLARRSADARRRLVLLFGTNVLAYLNPLDGAELRRLRFAETESSCSNGCELQYIAFGEQAGSWIASTPFAPFAVVDRSLRGVTGGLPFPDFSMATSMSATTPGLVHFGRGNAILETYRVEQDGLFEDGLEGW